MGANGNFAKQSNFYLLILNFTIMEKVTKTKEQVLAEIMVKVISGQQLTNDENKVLAENVGTLKTATTTLKNVGSKVKEAEQAEKLEKHKKEFSTFLESFKKDVSSKTFETGADLKNWLKDQIKNVPVLKSSKGSGSTAIGPKETTSAGSYPDIIKKALIAAGEKGLTFTEIGAEIEKEKPETAKMNATGKEKLWEVYAKRTPDWFPNVKMEYANGVKKVKRNAHFTWV